MDEKTKQNLCMALKQNIPDEAHDEGKYKDMETKYPKFSGVFRMLSDNEKDHKLIQEWLYKENC